LIGPPIVAEGLRRDFGGAPVLAGLDLTVDAGEVVVLLGANGAGKTTLLRVLATLLRPSGGSLRIFGEDASRRPPAARRRLGHVGHESACYPDLTGQENLQFYAELHGVPDPAGRIADLLRWAGLEGAARRPVRVYSRGMAQRLALARALLHGPELLLLDEPFSGLDPAGTTRLQTLLAELRLSGHAIVLSTHDIERVAPVATRVAILHRGRIAWMQDGAADAVVLAAAYDTVVTGRA
jgi:heme ABC exporter ATP-binding subunit CcmA